MVTGSVVVVEVVVVEVEEVVVSIASILLAVSVRVSAKSARAPINTMARAPAAIRLVRFMPVTVGVGQPDSHRTPAAVTALG